MGFQSIFPMNKHYYMLYADDLCIVSLSSAGLQNLLSICDKYCARHSITSMLRNLYACFSKVALTNIVIMQMYT